MMLSLNTLIVSALLIAVGNSCSLLVPEEGTYYISDVTLLDDDATHNDKILLTIHRSSGATVNANSPFTWSDTSGGPWCKIMDINDGSVGDTVDCNFYKVRESRYWSDADVDETATTVKCTDNCDEATATCNITRGGTEHIILPDVRYVASASEACFGGNQEQTNIFTGFADGISKSFTVHQNQDTSSRTITFIIFKSNIVAISWDDLTTYTEYDVTGDVVDPWTNTFVVDPPLSYPLVDVLKIPLPCCLCYGYTLSTYALTIDTTSNTMNVVLDQLGSGGGQVDARLDRVYNWGLGYGQTVQVFDVSAGTENTFTPNICDVEETCNTSPCASSTCAYNPNAVCVDDNCGGCNARWFCGDVDVTLLCNSGTTSTDSCSTTTTTPTTTGTAGSGITPQSNDANICYQIINIASFMILLWNFVF